MTSSLQSRSGDVETVSISTKVFITSIFLPRSLSALNTKDYIHATLLVYPLFEVYPCNWGFSDDCGVTLRYLSHPDVADI